MAVLARRPGLCSSGRQIGPGRRPGKGAPHAPRTIGCRHCARSYESHWSHQDARCAGIVGAFRINVPTWCWCTGRVWKGAAGRDPLHWWVAPVPEGSG